ncbi:MAG: putative toxin-antitoxin system toxin component, PIN family [Bacteroidia bacterium]
MIGKKLSSLKEVLINQKIKLVFSPQLFLEIKLVAQYERFEKYFKKREVETLISLLQIIAEVFDDTEINPTCRDRKDDYLLALSHKSNADYLVTSDKDLLVLQSYHHTKIISVKEFVDVLETI